MEEVWKDVRGFSGYQISNFGRVKSFRKYKNGRIRKLERDKDGYGCCRLSGDKKSYLKKCHRLVAEEFIDNPNNHKQVNHKNGIKDDNRAENLEWISNIDNQRHAYLNGLKGKLKKEDVVEIRNRIKNGESNTIIAFDFNVDRSTISNIKTGKTWKFLKENK